ncbi:MAG: NADH:ubiquinone reductase (Na(+)-transporting) subunit A, partial [Gammaproteobacteria bacterium]|nr:NADH:ubiquinone reductase (Na(+)-transporting) subunit A [Gammaproteobacteria bacterium]NIO63259.1 NADH:ubiquinone reductase (Na(+)-transporting) subunit A [Gammaproteobacteria bacterium]
TDLVDLDSDSIRKQLQDSGLWSAFRSRPFNTPPSIDSQPHALFVTAMDSNALAADPAVIIANYQQEFINGLIIVSRLADVPVFICKAPWADILV